ncbi:MAG: flagellar basal body rod protein FlgC [Gemmatimonadaceae bacterium]|nr:flagellar basal body rod protein FlgC [Gemmatimonadaceae bacterium]
MPRINPPVNPASLVNKRPPMFRGLGIAASGLDAQRLRMDVAAANIANADVTRTAEGGPYKRRVVELETASQTQFTKALSKAQGLMPAEVAKIAAVSQLPGETGPNQEFGVAVSGVSEDQTAGPRVYEPGHPDADADGYVTYPNVRVTDEIIDLMDARRLFEANATVFQVAKAMLRRAIDI